MKFQLFLIFTLLGFNIHAAMSQNIAELGPMPPYSKGKLAHNVAAYLQSAGYKVTIIAPEALTDLTKFNTHLYHLLILPRAEFIPAADQEPVLSFLKEGGRMLCIGGPPFIHPLYPSGSGWVTESERLEQLTGPNIFNFTNAEPQGWPTAAMSPNTHITFQLQSSHYGPAIKMDVQNYAGWCNATTPPFPESPFGKRNTVTIFQAKGDKNTHAFVMEWDERDGSRWIAPIPLTTRWRKYAILPSDFRFWPDGPQRSAPGELFNPANVRYWRIGLADSHAPMAPGNYSFEIADLRAAPAPPASLSKPISLETLSPDYVGYSTSDGEWRPVVRERGIGITGERPGRMILPNSSMKAPFDNSCWIYLSLSPPTRGDIWGGISYPKSFQSVPQRLLLLTVHKLLQNVFLTRAGSDQVCYRTKEPVIEARIFNSGSTSSMNTVKMSCYHNYSTSKPVFTFIKSVTVPSQQAVTLSSSIFPLKPGEYETEVELFNSHDSLIDRITEPIRVLTPNPAFSTDFIRVKNGEFTWKGKPWRPVGLNYWPGWIAGENSARYHLDWLAPEMYDPDLVQRDLNLCHQLGFNVLSIQYNQPYEGPAVSDFLARCHNLGIKVNLFVQGANPLSFDPTLLKELLQAANIRGNSDIYAFDVAWEPHVGDHDSRKQFDPQWRDWIKEQYGNLENAEQEWDMAAPRDKAGTVTNPSDAEMSSDGTWRKMVAAYRRFLDDIISRGYQRTVSTLHPYGPLVGARSGYGGNGSPFTAGIAAFDLLSGASHLDFISPEGYALNGSWEHFRGGGFTTAYARWAGNNKPVFWAEFGQSVLPLQGIVPTPQALAMQEAYYDKTCRLVADSGANGCAAWWFPGGLRVDEHSDFGVISPDGAPRPAAIRLSKFAKYEMPSASVDPSPNAWFTIDRDSDARGYAGLYAHFLPLYAQDREEGKMPGVRTAGSNTTTATVPLTAVGDIPSNGRDPLQFVNAEIVGNGDKLLVTNTGEAKWIAKGAGRVDFLIMQDDKIVKEIPIPHSVPRYGTLKIDIHKFYQSQNFAGNISVRAAILGRPAPIGERSIIPFGEAITIR